MCTAATYTTDSFYFGRNLDYEFSYGDEVTITPRAYPFALRCMGDFRTKYAMIGMAYVAGEYPLYYDAVNEKGLGIAGLNFVGNAVYHPAAEGKNNVAQFELIPWLLGSCATLAEVRTLLAKTNIVNIPFSEQLPLAQLHWLIADKTGSIVVESTADGLHIYDNPVGVLTNNPPFPQQLFALNNYRALSPRTPAVAFADGLDLPVYSRPRRTGPAGRSVQPVPLCACGLCADEREIRQRRGRERRAVLPHPARCRAAARLL